MSDKNIKRKLKSNCESCVNYVYDEFSEMYCCLVNLDEDEMIKFISNTYESCPYYRFDDEYSLSRKQASSLIE